MEETTRGSSAGAFRLESISLSVPAPDARHFELAVLAEATRRKMELKTGADLGEVEMEDRDGKTAVSWHADIENGTSDVSPREFFEALVGDEFDEAELRASADAMDGYRQARAACPTREEIRGLQQAVARALRPHAPASEQVVATRTVFEWDDLGRAS